MLAQFVFSQSCLSALALGVFGSFRWVSKMRETKNIMEYEIELRKLLNEKNLISKLTITWWEKKNGQNDDFKSCVIISSKQIKTFVFLTSGLSMITRSNLIKLDTEKQKSEIVLCHKLQPFLSDTIIWNLNVFSENHFVKRNFAEDSHKWKWKKSLFWHLLQIFWFSLVW